jgi:predicted GIY-YIG superfamily endonuclease
MAYVYILRSVKWPGEMYVGFSADLDQRLKYHNSGRSPHTYKFMPWEIVYTEQFESAAEAQRRERQIKGWTRAKKEALVARDFGKLRSLAKWRGIRGSTGH